MALSLRTLRIAAVSAVVPLLLLLSVPNSVSQDSFHDGEWNHRPYHHLIHSVSNVHGPQRHAWVHRHNHQIAHHEVLGGRRAPIKQHQSRETEKSDNGRDFKLHRPHSLLRVINNFRSEPFKDKRLKTAIKVQEKHIALLHPSVTTSVPTTKLPGSTTSKMETTTAVEKPLLRHEDKALNLPPKKLKIRNNGARDKRKFPLYSHRPHYIFPMHQMNLKRKHKEQEFTGRKQSFLRPVLNSRRVIVKEEAKPFTPWQHRGHRNNLEPQRINSDKRLHSPKSNVKPSTKELAVQETALKVPAGQRNYTQADVPLRYSFTSGRQTQRPAMFPYKVDENNSLGKGRKKTIFADVLTCPKLHCKNKCPLPLRQMNENGCDTCECCPNSDTILKCNLECDGGYATDTAGCPLCKCFEM